MYDPKEYFKWFENIDNINKIELYRYIKEEIYSDIKNPTVYDIGCGLGYLTSYVGGTGFDISGYAVSNARKKYPYAKFYHTDAARINLSKLKLPKADFIICLNLLEHMEDKKREKVLSDVIPEMMKKNSKVFFSLQRQFYIFNIINMLLKRHSFFDLSHIHNWTVGAFIQVVEKHFQILSVRQLAGYSKLISFTKYLKNETLVIAKLA